MTEAVDVEPGVRIDPTERVDLLLRDLRSSRSGLTTREAQRRLIHVGPNELRRRGGRRWPGELASQFTHPLALLLWAATGLAWAVGIRPVAIAIVVVIVINAMFAFVQERHAEKAVEALAAYLPARAKVLRDGQLAEVEATGLVPGDVLLIAEGDRVSADARLLDGGIEVDLSALTGESMPAFRSADLVDTRAPLLHARDLVFSGTSCTEGEARAVVFATGMRTELGRIAALSERVKKDESPLEAQVRRVAWLIALVSVLLGVAFIPIATLGAGLSLLNAVIFAVGLLVGNVPEGLLPVITLALAIGVRDLARRGAVVKRLSAVETLGSTSVICTDKTGTLTENRMQVAAIHTAAGVVDTSSGQAPSDDVTLERIAVAMSACNNARIDGQDAEGDPTEIALLNAAAAVGVHLNADDRQRIRINQFHFDPARKRMSTIDNYCGGTWVHTKGAPETVLPLCTEELGTNGHPRTLTPHRRDALAELVDAQARKGLRVLAVAERRLDGDAVPENREQAEQDLVLLGLVDMVDPPRPEVAGAVSNCHAAGIRIIVITGDHGLTAAAIASQAGIIRGEPTVVTGDELDRMNESELDELLDGPAELIFARSSPEAKLRIADALQDAGHVVAMTGDGVNDAPALRRADIGVAMGRSGTDVAREASTMVLTDDNFATITAAVQAGRQVYDNIRKFIFYIFAHATPEVTPFVVFALSGGAIPLPLTVLQLLAFDVGTETLPALALGREPAEPGLMQQPPRRRSDGRQITVCCAEGEQGHVYAGVLDYDEREIELGAIHATKTQVMFNVADPSAAFRWWRLPADGVGLVRMEFVINNHIKIHPMALVGFDQLTDVRVRNRISELTRGYADKTEFFVERLAHGIARIAAAWWPKPVIVRTSDFKTNEYARLIGGEAFEPGEENPMLGWRGASRYYGTGYREGFGLECRALRRVRDEMGLTNTIVMIPFCRTVDEADRVLATMANFGLHRGRNGLQVYVMAEIPSNIILAEDFADRFDGFSIGSNDLTQLTLGVDRDAGKLASLFDERDPAVRRSIETLINSAHNKHRKVGLCGQRPSDDPDFARLLVRAGIDSISVTPDSFLAVKDNIAIAERELRQQPLPAQRAETVAETARID